VFVSKPLAEQDAVDRCASVLEDYADDGYVVEIRYRPNRHASSKHAILQYDASYRDKNINSWKIAARVWIEAWEVQGSVVDALADIKEDVPRLTGLCDF